MKKLVLNSVASVFLIVATMGCKKYPKDDKGSLLPKKSLLCNNWGLESVIQISEPFITGESVLYFELNQTFQWSTLSQSTSGAILEQEDEYEGTWKFSNHKNELILEATDTYDLVDSSFNYIGPSTKNVTLTLEILKLDGNEFWFSYEGKEFHYTPTP
ncbi:MAG TPA: hypothetical protein DCQ93_04625 [Bacteroidetes bacterium]|nr:hypothetical protein [Bacteroidota bacterium]